MPDGRLSDEGASIEHWFYHLEHSTLEAVLPDILEKTRAKNWRALVKIGSCKGEPITELARLDAYLWAYKQDSFLPHGRDDEPLADSQPILLSTQANDTQNADVIILICGAEIADTGNAQRCITILDGHNDEDKAVARKRWKQVKTDGLKAAYWQQNQNGRWVQPIS